MSTKCSVVWGNGLHFYTDCFDDEHVFLELEGVNFEAYRDRVTVEIPKAIWAAIRQPNVVETDLLDKTDDDIRLMVEKAVDERIKDQSGKEGILALAGSWVYGNANESRDYQIGMGVAHHLEERTKQRRWRDEAAEIWRKMTRPKITTE